MDGVSEMGLAKSEQRPTNRRELWSLRSLPYNNFKAFQNYECYLIEIWCWVFRQTTFATLEIIRVLLFYFLHLPTATIGRLWAASGLTLPYKPVASLPVARHREWTL